MSRHMISRRACVMGASAAALSACGSGAVPRDSFYRLAAPISRVGSGAPVFEGTIEVPPFHAEGIINERAILYREGPLSLAQYSYHAWIEPPSVMVQQRFVDALRRSQTFTTVATPEMRLDRDYELLGNITQWEQDPGQLTVPIQITLALRRVAGNQEILIKTYNANDPTGDASVAAAVVAFSHGIDKIVVEFLSDLTQVPKTPPIPR